MVFVCWAVPLTMIVLEMKGVPKDNVNSLVNWTMTVSLAMSVLEVSVQWAANPHRIAQPPILALETSVPILAVKPLAVPMPNVPLLTKKLSALVWPDFCLTPPPSLDAPVNRQLA